MISVNLKELIQGTPSKLKRMRGPAIFDGCVLDVCLRNHQRKDERSSRNRMRSSEDLDPQGVHAALSVLVPFLEKVCPQPQSYHLHYFCFLPIFYCINVQIVCYDRIHSI